MGLPESVVVGCIEYRVTEPEVGLVVFLALGAFQNRYSFTRDSAGAWSVAWGSPPTRAVRALAAPQVALVCELAERNSVPLMCLGTCADGQPRHPLYVSANTSPETWTPTGMTPRPRPPLP